MKHGLVSKLTARTLRGRGGRKTNKTSPTTQIEISVFYSILHVLSKSHTAENLKSARLRSKWPTGSSSDPHSLVSWYQRECTPESCWTQQTVFWKLGAIGPTPI